MVQVTQMLTILQDLNTPFHHKHQLLIMFMFTTVFSVHARVVRMVVLFTVLVVTTLLSYLSVEHRSLLAEHRVNTEEQFILIVKRVVNVF